MRQFELADANHRQVLDRPSSIEHVRTELKASSQITRSRTNSEEEACRSTKSQLQTPRSQTAGFPGVSTVTQPFETGRWQHGDAHEDALDPKDNVSAADYLAGTSEPSVSRSSNTKGGQASLLDRPFPMHLRQPMSNTAKRPVRLLIASLGNPSPYQNTRHSAGHILLKSLQSHLSLPALSKSKSFGGYVSTGADVGRAEWTLFQSPSLMNISGGPILKAYRAFLNTVNDEAKASDSEIVDGLVILHDEMETAPSTVKLRRGATSAKGHNGIKSVQQTLQSVGLLDNMCKGGAKTGSAAFRQPGDRFIKIAVGIGRPEGKTRDRDDVSAYVLGQLTSGEQDGIDQTTSQVIHLLEGEMARLSLASS